ncbi:MAG: 3'-5' exonuclease [Pseudobdellovibrionaceae bacterium]|nr:3'-5' exonuclease [Bdellovibrionales bacterium]USN46958.1 MAG: 3'-5' exonuclease [Pseudobdellovibrionaceae bacterium]
MTFVAFDLETTGTLAGVDRIVEIGAIRFDVGGVDAVFSTLVDPKMHIPEDASAVNGITDDMVVGKPTIETLLEPFAEFCDNSIIIAHNAVFDYQFLTADIEKYEAKAPKGTIIDTYSISKKVFPGLPNYKLGTLVQHLKIPSGQFHRAEEDASYCGQLFLKIIEKISGPGAMPPLENLIALTGKAELKFPQIEPQPKQLALL